MSIPTSRPKNRQRPTSSRPNPARVLEARIYGIAIEALCGHVWVPSRDPKQLPLCEACKSVYEMYRMFNDGLNNAPDE
jgi:hypothetical protein